MVVAQQIINNLIKSYAEKLALTLNYRSPKDVSDYEYRYQLVSDSFDKLMTILYANLEVRDRKLTEIYDISENGFIQEFKKERENESDRKKETIR